MTEADNFFRRLSRFKKKIQKEIISRLYSICSLQYHKYQVTVLILADQI